MSILVKNKEGVFKDVALGYDTLEELEPLKINYEAGKLALDE